MSVKEINIKKIQEMRNKLLGMGYEKFMFLTKGNRNEKTKGFTGKFEMDLITIFNRAN
jgi:hypothetical protein